MIYKIIQFYGQFVNETYFLNEDDATDFYNSKCESSKVCTSVAMTRVYEHRLIDVISELDVYDYSHAELEDVYVRVLPKMFFAENDSQYVLPNGVFKCVEVDRQILFVNMCESETILKTYNKE